MNTTREAVRNMLTSAAVQWHITGSRYICSPAPTDTDEDYIVLIKYAEAIRAIEFSGFTLNTDPDLYEAMPDFWALRKGEYNLIITNDPVFYHRFMAATEYARARNLLQKEDRIALFQTVLYGNAAA